MCSCIRKRRQFKIKFISKLIKNILSYSIYSWSNKLNYFIFSLVLFLKSIFIINNYTKKKVKCKTRIIHNIGHVI